MALSGRLTTSACSLLLLVAVVAGRDLPRTYLVDSKLSPPTTAPPPGPYEPTWDSLDSRPIPPWYDDVKFGIFLHWGVYCVPGVGSEWFWNSWKSNSTEASRFMSANYPPGFTYQDFASQFTAEFFNATEWAEIFYNSGAKYVVLTSKHHEGYTLWPSSFSFSWNSQDVGPHRDLLGELAAAVRSKPGLHFGVYYSLYEWFNRMYVHDRETNFTKSTYVDRKMLPEMVELITKYKPDVLWTDGDWEAEHTYFKSQKFLTWLYNESPVKDKIVTNDRWGKNIGCHHGGVFTCTDRYNPHTLFPHKWENAMTVDREAWGFRRNAKLEDFLSLRDLLEELITTVSCGGNLLMNVGPSKEGTIAPIFQERLKGMGKWLKINGDAIYHTTYWLDQNDTISGNVWYTMPKVFKSYERKPFADVYASVIGLPDQGQVLLGSLRGRLTEGTSEVLLVVAEGDTLPLKWKDMGDMVVVHLPVLYSLPTVIAETGVFVLKIRHVYNIG